MQCIPKTAWYEQALRLDPTSAEAYNGKAISLVFLGRGEEALAAYEHVIRLDDDPGYSYPAYMNSTTILATLSRYEEALAACEGAIRLEPSYAYAHVDKGWLVRAQRRAQALQDSPDGTLAHVMSHCLQPLPGK
jgi:tetratricopeptide (TPR) repeat protein